MNQRPPTEHPSWVKEIRAAIEGAWRLFLFDASALERFNDSTSAFLRSFLAAVIAAPAYALIFLIRSRMPIDPHTSGGKPVPAFADQMRLELLTYPLGWLLFPIAMVGLSALLNVAPRYRRYVTVYNWGGMIIALISLIPYVLFALRILGPQFATSVDYLLQIAFLGYLWFLARIGLGVPGFTALGLVAIDVLLTMLGHGLVAKALGLPVS